MFLKNNKLFIGSGVVFFLFSFVESWRNSRLTANNEDLIFSYSTYLAICIIIMLYCFFAILARYKNKYNKQHTLLKTIYIPIMVSLMFMGYYLGLNFDSILGVDDAKEFFFILPVWGHCLLLPSIMACYTYFVWKNTHKKKVIGFVTVIFSLILILMLSTVITSFVSQFDIF